MGFLLSVSAGRWMMMKDKGGSELACAKGLIDKLPAINPTIRTWPSWRGLWRKDCSLLWRHGLERMATMLQRQELKATYWREETLKIRGCRSHRMKMIPKWEPWRRHLGMKCHFWELASKPEEQGCRWAAVLIFSKGCEKHGGEKAVQKNLCLQTNHEKGVFGAVLNEYWMNVTEYKMQEDTDLWRSRIAAASYLKQMSSGSREDYSVGGLGCTRSGREPQSVSTLLQSRTSMFLMCREWSP